MSLFCRHGRARVGGRVSGEVPHRTYPGGQPLETCVDSSQIFKANKQVHFRRLREEFPTVAFEEMLFFDNEIANVRAVSQLGVRCVHCPRGLTAAAWEEGLRLFR